MKKRPIKKYPQSHSYKPVINIGVNALVFKNPITGVAKRILSLYSPAELSTPVALRITFFTPHSFSPTTIAQIASHGIHFDSDHKNQDPRKRSIAGDISYSLVETEGGLLRRVLSCIPMGRETVEWWWTHMSIPRLLEQYKIDLYDAQWGGGLPTRFPYKIYNWWKRLQMQLKISGSFTKNARNSIGRTGNSNFFHHLHFALSIHDVIPLKIAEFSRPTILERMEAYLFRLRVAANLKYADTIITVSPAVKADLNRLFSNEVQGKTIVVHPNGVGVNAVLSNNKKPNLQSFSTKPEYQNSIALKLTGPNEKEAFVPYVFYLGGFNPRKNLPLLIKALDDLPLKKHLKSTPVTLIMAGKTNHYFSKVLVPLLERVHYPVIALGYVNDDELIQFLKNSAGVCYPSLAEGFGMPPLEALQEGAQVIIDERLPIHLSSQHNTNTFGKTSLGDLRAVVEWLVGSKSQPQAKDTQKKPKKINPQAIIEWWEKNVTALDLSAKNPRAKEELALALARLVISASINKKNRRVPPDFLGVDSSLAWHNLAREYQELLVKKIYKNN